MALISDRAIVLRRLDYSETSQVLAVLTRDNGQQRLIAKGIKRSTKNRVAVGIDLLELGGVVFSHRVGKESTLSTLTEWKQQNAFAHLRNDLAKCYAAQYAAEVTSQLTEAQDPHPDLFDAMVSLFETLESSDALASLVGYLLTLLQEIGIQPQWTQCVSCQRDVSDDETIYFSSRQGGAVCRDCEPAIVEKRRTTPGALKILASKSSHASDAQTAFGLLDYHLRELMARPAKLSPMLRAAVGMPNNI